MRKALVWLRRDLRATDHAALAAATREAERVWCVFVLDTTILSALPRRDRRVEFILAALQQLQPQLGLIIRHGDPRSLIPQLAQELGVDVVHANHDDEPAAQARDAHVAQALAAQGRAWHSHKDHVVFERSEVLTGTGKPYTVFTPYKNSWLKRVTPADLAAHEVRAGAIAHDAATPVPTLADIGFEPAGLTPVVGRGPEGAQTLLADFLGRMALYGETRDYPGIKGPSYLSVHLRFGTVSIRELARAAWPAANDGAGIWLSELIWRDFYHQLLHHFPQVERLPFKPEFAGVAWEQGPQADAHFEAWCEGRTGYPLVDAGMRQLKQTGSMHNRLRMVTASFLTKDLGLDWRRGEAWFAEQLLDFDLAANNGGWQWAASTGCDAQPWFRIFNPVTQSEKFDPQGQFIRRYCPELAHFGPKEIHAPWLAGGPAPIVDHAEARARTLARFEAIKRPG
jgi:deoxyribodipyrimidine photo-lyase